MKVLLNHLDMPIEILMASLPSISSCLAIEQTPRHADNELAMLPWPLEDSFGRDLRQFFRVAVDLALAASRGFRHSGSPVADPHPRGRGLAAPRPFAVSARIVDRETVDRWWPAM